MAVGAILDFCDKLMMFVYHIELLTVTDIFSEVRLLTKECPFLNDVALNFGSQTRPKNEILGPRIGLSSVSHGKKINI